MMDMRYLAAQIFGAAGIIAFVLCYHFKNMKSVLKVKLSMDVIWASHYFLLGAYAAAGTNLICCVRELIFMNNDKKIFRHRAWLAIFVVMNWISAAITWQNGFSLLPALASTLATFSFWQKDVKIARRIALLNNILMFTYDIEALSYAGMAAEVLAFCSVLSAMWMNR